MKSTTLSDVSESIAYGLTASASDSAVGPRFMRITDIVGGSIDIRTVPYVEADHATEAKYALCSGDIVVARTGATVGASCWFEGSEESVVFASYLVRFRVRPEVNSRYVGYVLKSNLWSDFIKSNAHSKSAQPNISASSMSAFTFPLPVRRSQDAIADVLGALDDKIAANRRVVAGTHALGEAILKAHDLTPRPLSEVATITMGTSPRGEFLHENGAGIPFFQGVRDFGAVYPAHRVNTENPVKTTPDGSILFAVRAPVGKINLARGTTAIGRGLAGISTPSQRATLYYAMGAFESVWDEFQGGGTVFASVNGNDVKTTQIPMPDSNHESALEERLAPLLDRAVASEAESEALASTRDELLPLLMSGKITVKDAEKQVEETA